MKWLRAITIVALAAKGSHGQTVTVFQSGFEPGEGYTLGSLTDVRVASDGDQLLFGYGPSDAVPVASSVPFEFRHVLNYQTGLIMGWMNGQVVYEDLPPFSTLIPDSLAFELSSRLDNLPFATQVWFDDLHVTATYVPSPGTSLLALAGGLACLRRRRAGLSYSDVS